MVDAPVGANGSELVAEETPSGGLAPRGLVRKRLMVDAPVGAATKLAAVMYSDVTAQPGCSAAQRRICGALGGPHPSACHTLPPSTSAMHAWPQA